MLNTHTHTLKLTNADRQRNLWTTFAVITDKICVIWMEMNLSIMFGYCLGVKCVFPWNEIVELIWDTTGGWWGFNECLFDLGIENYKVISSCWFVLFNNKYHVGSHLCALFLSSVHSFVLFVLSSNPLLFCLDMKAWFFCAALLLHQSPSKSMNDTREGKKKENVNKIKIGYVPLSFPTPQRSIINP